MFMSNADNGKPEQPARLPCVLTESEALIELRG